MIRFAPIQRMVLRHGGHALAGVIRLYAVDLIDESAPDDVSSDDTTPDTSSDSASPTPSIEAEAATSAVETDPESDVPEISKPTAASLSLSLDDANLGLCAHDYWPLWPGTSWTYNSRDTSYTQNVDDVSDNQAMLSTQYEGRNIQARLLCSREGLGGVYLGDMRRITELGDLNFSNPRGVYLPRPETMEEIGPNPYKGM